MAQVMIDECDLCNSQEDITIIDNKYYCNDCLHSNSIWKYARNHLLEELANDMLDLDDKCYKKAFDIIEEKQKGVSSE